MKNQLRSYGQVQQRSKEGPVRTGNFISITCDKKRRGAPKMAYMDAVRKDIKKIRITAMGAHNTNTW